MQIFQSHDGHLNDVYLLLSPLTMELDSRREITPLTKRRGQWRGLVAHFLFKQSHFVLTVPCSFGLMHTPIQAGN